MNLRASKSPYSVLRISLIGLVACMLTVVLGASWPRTHARAAAAEPHLIVHEWGTFTSVAGSDGNAVEWSALGDWPNELPGFVENFFPAFKLGLRGTIRMETPVIYFYSPNELNVSVKVAFSKGQITEWYPHATSVSSSADISHTSLYSNPSDGTISWSSVHLQPGTAPNFPREQADRPYYEARQTSSVPLSVTTAKRNNAASWTFSQLRSVVNADQTTGEQHEKFLFYRGVSSSAVPVSAQVTSGGKLIVKNLGNDEVPSLILFERRGEKIGYRVSGGLRREAVMDPPELTTNIESVYADIEQILAAQGLYRDEAHAMVRTWRSSWFEEGSRLLYIVPEGFVNTILPLNITPDPNHTVRVFVGRLEVVTPATQKAVQTALTSHDHVALQKYSRFLEPILVIMERQDSSNQRYIKEFMDSPSFSDAPDIVQCEVMAALEDNK
jgi:hypothetical protein